MVWIVGPRRDLVQASRRERVAQASPKWALPERSRWIVNFTVTFPGQVTFRASRSMSKRSLANRPPRPAGAWVRQPESIPESSSTFLELTTAVCRVSVYFRSVVTAAFRPRGVGVGVATSVLFVFGGVTGRVRFGFRGQIVQKLSRQPGIGGGVSGGVARGFLWNQVGDQVGRDARIPGVAVVSVTTSLS